MPRLNSHFSARSAPSHFGPGHISLQIVKQLHLSCQSAKNVRNEYFLTPDQSLLWITGRQDTGRTEPRKMNFPDGNILRSAGYQKPVFPVSQDFIHAMPHILLRRIGTFPAYCRQAFPKGTIKAVLHDQEITCSARSDTKRRRTKMCFSRNTHFVRIRPASRSVPYFPSILQKQYPPVSHIKIPNSRIIKTT